MIFALTRGSIIGTERYGQGVPEQPGRAAQRIFIPRGLLGANTQRIGGPQAQVLRDKTHANNRDGEAGYQPAENSGLLRNLSCYDRATLLRQVGTGPGCTGKPMDPK
jgi:hypothetical protein